MKFETSSILAKTCKYILALLTTILILQSCSKKSDPIMEYSAPAVGVLTILIDGIEEEAKNPKQSRMMAKLATTGEYTTLLSAIPQFISYDGFDAALSIESVPAETKVASNAQPTSVSQKMANLPNNTTIKMPNGTKTRIILIDEDRQTIVHNKEVIAGTETTLDVNKGKTYKWVAYSYNDKEINAPVVTSLTDLSFTTENKYDLLYKDGEITIPDDPADVLKPLAIKFNHMLRRVAVEINTRGMFASLTSANVEIDASVLKTGSFNVLTGTVSNLRNASGKISSTKFTKTGNRPLADQNAFYFYTASNEAIPSFTATINNFEIKLAHGANIQRKFTNSSSYDFKGVPPKALGTSTTLAIDLVESAISVGSAKWARSNLRYAGNMFDKYVFAARADEKPEPETHYWNWKSRTPKGNSENFDPCKSVYPNNTWRMPTPSEWKDNNEPSKKVAEYGLLIGAFYAVSFDQQNPQPSNYVYPEYQQEIYFAVNGHRRRNSNNLRNEPFGVVAGALGKGTAYYWTSSTSDEKNANAWTISFSQVAWIVNWDKVKMSTFDKRLGFSIRCVRS